MFRRSPRTALLWAAALLVAGLTAVTVTTSLASLRHQDSAYGSLHTVVIARRDLSVGVRLAAADLTTRRLRGEAPADDTLTSVSRAVGRTVRASLLRGDAITRRHLTDGARGAWSEIVPVGHRAVRVVTEHGVRPTVGDVVDVLATFDPATLTDGNDPTVVVAPAVPVLAVDALEGGSDTVGITLLVTSREASRVAFSVAAGTVSIALAPPEAADGRG
ncbi:MAG: Flp pilus assembly protein CpaB [Acidimicrobiia bacterium]